MGRLSLGTHLWFWISMPVVIWDLTYVLFRPRSMPGGDLFWICASHLIDVIYGKHDGRYVDIDNDWVKAQSIGNAIEILVTLVGLLFMRSGRLQSLTLWTSALMTLWKTVLYFVVEACSGWKYTGQSTPYAFWMLFVLPSFFWLAGPAWALYDTGRNLISHHSAVSSSPKRKSH